MRRRKGVKWFRERWLPKQDYLTRGDIHVRDKWLLWYITKWLYGLGITANHITLLGVISFFVWLVLYDVFFIRQFWIQNFFIVLIGATDFIDGPQARNNDDITPEGILGDYLRDILYLLYLVRVVMDYGLPFYMFTPLVLVEALVIYFKTTAFINYFPGNYTLNSFFDFIEDNLQGEFKVRFKFFSSCFGLSSFMAGVHWNNTMFYIMGTALIWISVGAGIIVCHKEATWKPTLKEEK